MVQHINATLRSARENAFQLCIGDIDMAYRTGRVNKYSNYPRTITVIFLRKGIKQMVISTKRALGWDNSKVSYSDDLTYDVKKHREVLKAIASRAQHSQHVTKMAGNRLIIDGVSYGADEMDIIPGDLKRAVPQIKPVKNGIAFRGKEAYLSNFFPVEVKIEGEEYSCIEQYYQFTKCETCLDFDRANKIISTDDPVHMKSIGDGCKENEEWKEIKVFTMFRGIFYKFSQNENLALKLISTENDGLFEATTDLFWSAGIGFNSKKWETQLWNGKNVTGTLLSKVRRILRNKMDEGIELRKLVFNYSLPSLQHDRSGKHQALRELFLPEERCESIMEIQEDVQVGGGSPENLPDQLLAPVEEVEYPGNEEGGLSELLEAMGDISHDRRSSRCSDQSLYTLARSAAGWASRRKSHSVVNTSKGMKQRGNPPRGSDSLTRRERDLIYRTEYNNTEGHSARQAGYERNYGTTWPKGTVTTSTPMMRGGGGPFQGPRPPMRREEPSQIGATTAVGTRAEDKLGATPIIPEGAAGDPACQETRL